MLLRLQVREWETSLPINNEERLFKLTYLCKEKFVKNFSPSLLWATH